MAEQFNLPDIGSGLQEAEIVSWLVEVGDEVTTDQVLCEVETEKSVVEIPVPCAGIVLELAGPPGTSVKVGEMLVVIGAAVPLQLVWNIADITNILMALPNLLGLILLAGLVKKLKDDYFSRPHEKTPE